MPAIEQRLLTHVRYLSDAIGPRPSGSPGCHAAADYIAADMAAAGLAVERQRYSCLAWDHNGTELSLNGVPLTAAANAFSPPCDIRATTLPLGTLPALQAADIAGRIVVLHGDLAAPLPPRGEAAADEHGARVMAALEAGRPAAVLTVQPGEAVLPRLIEDAELTIPSATVPARAGLLLMANPGAPARLRIFSARRPGTSTNVVARLGSGPGGLLISAYYDTKIDTPGATDTAGGVAVLLELARALAARPLTRPVELVALSGKSYPPSGEAVYASASADVIGSLAATLNFSGVGQASSVTGVALSRVAPDLEAVVRAALARVPQALPAAERRPALSHPSLAGLPGITVSSVGGANLAYTRDDTAESIDPARLSEALALGVEIVDLLESRRPALCYLPLLNLVA